MAFPTRNLEHLSEADARFIEQYKERPFFTAWLASYVRQIQDLEDCIWGVIDGHMLDTAIGSQLDTLGDLVGEPRNGRDDARYRLAIRTKVLANRSRGTPPDLLGVARALLGNTYPVPIGYTEHHPAKLVLSFPQLLTDAERDELYRFLRLAKVAGVGLFVTDANADDGFLFNRPSDPDVSANGFSSLDRLLCLAMTDTALAINPPPQINQLAQQSEASTVLIGLADPSLGVSYDYGFSSTPELSLLNNVRISGAGNWTLAAPIVFDDVPTSPLGFTSVQLSLSAKRVALVAMYESDNPAATSTFLSFGTSGSGTSTPTTFAVTAQTNNSRYLHTEIFLGDGFGGATIGGDTVSFQYLNFPHGAVGYQAYAALFEIDELGQQLTSTVAEPTISTPPPLSIVDAGKLVEGGRFAHFRQV